MNHDRHAVLIRRAKDSPQLLEMFRVVHLHVRVTEVQLEAVFEIRILSASFSSVSAYSFSGLKLQNAIKRFGYNAACAAVQSFSARTFAYSSSTVRDGLPYM